MKKIITKRFLALLLMVVLLFTATSFPTHTEAAIKKVKLSKSKITLMVGDTVKLKLKNAKAKKIKWTTSKKKVATVSKNGKVSAKKKGKSIITAKYKGKKYNCKVTVKPLALNKKKAAIKVGDTLQLKLGSIKAAKIRWSSDNKAVATVSKKGKVTAKKEGSAKIIAKYKKKKYTCKISVKENKDMNASTYTRASWVATIVDKLDYSLSDDALLKDSKTGKVIYDYKDIDECEYADKIETAYKYGFASFIDPDDESSRV